MVDSIEGSREVGKSKDKKMGYEIYGWGLLLRQLITKLVSD